jgi:hypothetical protein
MITIALLLFLFIRDKDMNEIRFVLHRNIVETARQSGVPEYSTRDIQGFITYSINDIPADILARYEQSGYEISLAPLFAFTMHADKSNHNNLGVENVTLQFSSKPYKTHEDGKRFAEKVIAQMNGKKWRRHIEELCPAVTGRSALLDVEGKLGQAAGCPLDPNYALTKDEWVQMMREEQRYQWIGDGVLVTFRIAYSEDSRGITYKFFMEFDDFSIKKRKDDQRTQLSLKEGDEKGWGSTERHQKSIESTRELIKVLEANALKRGDHVVGR